MLPDLCFAASGRRRLQFPPAKVQCGRERGSAVATQPYTRAVLHATADLLTDNRLWCGSLPPGSGSLLALRGITRTILSCFVMVQRRQTLDGARIARLAHYLGAPLSRFTVWWRFDGEEWPQFLWRTMR